MGQPIRAACAGGMGAEAEVCGRSPSLHLAVLQYPSLGRGSGGDYSPLKKGDVWGAGWQSCPLPLSSMSSWALALSQGRAEHHKGKWGVTAALTAGLSSWERARPPACPLRLRALWLLLFVPVHEATGATAAPHCLLPFPLRPTDSSLVFYPLLLVPRSSSGR